VQAWLDRHGPYDAIVDGANVGLYNSNFGKGGFNFYQVNFSLDSRECSLFGTFKVITLCFMLSIVMIL